MKREFKKEKRKMNLEGKIINFMGDSITEGVGVENCLECRYDNMMKESCGLKEVHNYGVSGTRLAHQKKPSDPPRFDLCFCGRAYDLCPDADITVIYGGVNDYFHGDAPFGTMEDKTPATFCGGVEFLMTLLKELYPHTKIIFMTPARCHYESGTDELPSDREEKCADAKPLKEYVKVISEKGLKHNIPVLNLYERLPINPNIPEHNSKYTIDGLHFNAEGHKAIAALLADFIKNEV